MDFTSFLMGRITGGGGSSVTVEPLIATENKEYIAPSGMAYSPVTVNVPTGSAKPNYLISDSDLVSTFYFNTAYALGTWLATLTYSDLDPDTGLYVCYTGLGYFYGVDLTSGQYALVWNDGVNIVPIYSTVAVPAFGVTEAGWQMASYAPSASVTVDQDAMISALWTVLDDVVAKDDIAFGIELPQLNAPSISISQNTLNITNPSTNGNFVDEYKVYASGVFAGSTSSTSYDLSTLTGNSASVTVKATGDGFNDSAESTSASWTRYVQVSFYDGSSQMTGSPVSVAYGSTVAQAVTAGGINTRKTGYEFENWYSDSELTAVVPDDSVISSSMTLYGKWEEAGYIEYIGDYDGPKDEAYGSRMVFSPSGKFFAYIGNFYLRIVDTATLTEASNIRISTPQILTGQSLLWLNDNLIVGCCASSSAGSAFAIAVDANGNSTDVTSTYFPASITISGSGISCSTRPSQTGRIAMSKYANSTRTVYVIDTTTIPFTLLATVTPSSGTTVAVEIMDDNSLLRWVTISGIERYSPDNNYGGSPTTIVSTTGNDTGRLYAPYRVGGNTMYQDSKDTYSNRGGFYVWTYSNGTITQTKKSYANNTYYALNIDGCYIKKTLQNSLEVLTVYDSQDAFVYQLNTEFANSGSVLQPISQDGSLMLAEKYTGSSSYRKFALYKLRPLS